MTRKRGTSVELELLEMEAFEILEAREQNKHLYSLLKRIITMSTTEAEAITNLKAAVADTNAKVDALKTSVDAVIVAAGDDPTKVAALDVITAQVKDQQDKLQDITDAANAALVPVVA